MPAGVSLLTHAHNTCLNELTSDLVVTQHESCQVVQGDCKGKEHKMSTVPACTSQT